jgi:hypothetical protein
MEAICSSETSVDTQRTTWRYIAEDSTLHNHRCDNLKSYNSDPVYSHYHVTVCDVRCSSHTRTGRPAHSLSLYRLSYPGRGVKLTTRLNLVPR